MGCMYSHCLHSVVTVLHLACSALDCYEANILSKQELGQSTKHDKMGQPIPYVASSEWYQVIFMRGGNVAKDS
jgi:hypothetical protein